MECANCGKYFEYGDEVAGGNLCSACLKGFEDLDEADDFRASMREADKWRDPPVGTLDDTARRLFEFILSENERAWNAAAPGKPLMPWRALTWEKADKDRLRAMAKPIYEGAQLAAQNRRLCDGLARSLDAKRQRASGLSRLLGMLLRFLEWAAFGWRSKR